ncbi:MAG: amino acid adenylation domain-containing protein, partial [Dehalococcoidia bacterium]
ELRSYLFERLPLYMLPSHYVRMDAFPLNPRGKIDVPSLPLPATGPRVLRTIETGLEKMLQGIWEELLGCRVTSAEDDFFRLGGHSIHVMQLIHRVWEHCGRKLDIRQVFRYPSLGQQAGLLETMESGNAIITPAPAGVDIPLSFEQERLWFLYQLSAGDSSYNIPIVYHLEGALDVSLVLESITYLVDRHAALRTNVLVREGIAYQRILPTSGFSVGFTDLLDLPVAADDQGLSQLLAGELWRPFDLEGEYLFRAHLVREKDSVYKLLLNFHHLIHDGWGEQILLEDFSEVYARLASGSGSVPKAAAISYGDFSYWQRSGSDRYAAGLSYWRDRLRDVPLSLDLPFARPRGLGRGIGSTISRSVPPDLLREAESYGESRGLTVFMVMFGAFNILLHRYSGCSVICVGTTFANRCVSGVERVLGMMANTLPLRSDLDGDMLVSDYLLDLRRCVLDAHDYQDTPLSLIIEEVGPERNLDHSPFFQTLFNFMDSDPSSLHISGVHVRSDHMDNGTAKFDLSLAVQRNSDGADIHWEYNSDLFDRAHVDRMAGHYEHILRGMLDPADLKIGDIDFLLSDERDRLLHEFQGDDASFSGWSTLQAGFQSSASLHRDRVAVVRGEHSLTYGCLDRRSGILSSHLQSRYGIGRGSLVAILSDRTELCIEAILAVLKAGSAYIPLDTDYPIDRIGYILDDALPKLLLSDGDYAIDRPWLSVFNLTQGYEPSVDLSPAAASGEAGDLACVLYTSGTTGRPKGVCVLQKGLLNIVTHDLEAISGEGRYLQFSRFGFDISIYELFRPLVSGGSVLIVSSDSVRDIPLFVGSISKHLVTHLVLTASTIRLLKGWVLPSVTHVVSTGEMADPSAAAYYSGSKVFYNAYGPTECSVFATMYPVHPGWNGDRVPIGVGVRGLSLYVLDSRSRLQAEGVSGEICIAGAGLALGYLNNPELTAQSFMDNPYGDGKIYRTGDFGRWLPGGDLEYLGRRDDQVKVRGHRIELSEIDRTLRELGGVDCHVMVIGTGTSAEITVYYLGAYDRQGELRSYLFERLPLYMLPSHYVRMDAFPLNPRGKIDVPSLPLPA